MTMGWMETIRFIGLDLQVAAVFAAVSIDVAPRALKSAWDRIPRGARSRGAVPVRARRLSVTPRWNRTVFGSAQMNSVNSTILPPEYSTTHPSCAPSVAR